MRFDLNAFKAIFPKITADEARAEIHEMTKDIVIDPRFMSIEHDFEEDVIEVRARREARKSTYS